MVRRYYLVDVHTCFVQLIQFYVLSIYIYIFTFYSIIYLFITNLFELYIANCTY